MSYLKFGLVNILIFLTTAVLWADTVYLRGGTRIIGKIVDQNRTSMTIRVRGRNVKVAKKKVRRVSYGSAAEDARSRRAVERRLRLRREARIRKEAAEKRVREKRRAVAGTNTTAPTVSSGVFSGWEGAWRSTLIPGWGHYHGDDKLTGYVYGGAFLGALTLALALDANAVSARSAYRSELNRNFILAGPALGSLNLNNPPPALLVSLFLNNGSSSALEARRAEANASFQLLGLLYLAQIAHAFWDGRRAPRTRVISRAREHRAGDWRMSFQLSAGERGTTRIALETRF